MLRLLGNKATAIALMTGLTWLIFDPVAMAAGVTIASPSNGSTVSGMVTITLSPASGTSWCNVYVDGAYQNSTPPNFFYWQTSGTSNGTHKVSATAFDKYGSNLGTATSTVTVANGGAVSLTSPSNGSTVSGTVTIGVATGPSTSWANIYLNGEYQSSTPPDYFYWHTNGMPDGQYQVSATAFDSSGHNLGSSESSVTVANGFTAAASNAVSLSSPSNGSTVSGNVSIAAAIGSGVGWINFYVDGDYLSSSPPLNFNWNSGSVGNGNHTISARAFSSSGGAMGSASSTVSVQNSSVTSSGHFYTQPPGSSLPSGAACASAVRRNPNFEPRPENYTANHTVPTDNLSYMRTTTNNGGVPAHTYDRVDGNFTGTTDEIIQWGACKWGFDEDLVRAIAANESWWKQSAHGDFTTNLNVCPSGANYHDGGCDLSYGITQIKSTDYSGTFADSMKSTAFAIDYKLAYQRACYEGKIGYLHERSSNYPNGDQNNMLWGCVDQWFSGGWWNGSDDSYIAETKREMANKPWLQPGF